MNARKTNNNGLTYEKGQAQIIMGYATEKFIGFVIPENISNLYATAKVPAEYREFRRQLQNVLVGFFKGSLIHFTKELAKLNLERDPVLKLKKRYVEDQIKDLRDFVAASSWIDLEKASEMYFALHQRIEDLKAEQGVRGKLKVLQHSLGRLDSDLRVMIKVREISGDINWVLHPVRTLNELTEAFDVISKKAQPIIDEQARRSSCACRELERTGRLSLVGKTA